MGRRRVCPPKRQASLLSSRASKTTVLNIFLDARTREILCKPAAEQTRGRQAVYQRDEKRSLFLAANQWTVTFFVYKRFHARHVREIQRFSPRNKCSATPPPSRTKHPGYTRKQMQCLALSGGAQHPGAMVFRLGIQRFVLFPDMPCMKRVYRDKKASAHWSAARNEERSRSR